MNPDIIDLKKLREYTKEMCVLYVEDEKIIRDEIESFLKKFFPIVDTADNGKDGLKCHKKRKYDLVITDINMPKMNGIEMSKVILQEEPDQSIVIISAYNESEYLLESINTGIKYYLLKPLNIKQLTRVIYTIAKAKQNKITAQIHNESIKKQNIELEKNIKEKSEIIKQHVYKDTLTGIDNLYAFINNIKEHDQEKSNFTVLLLLDIDNLKDINDLYGTDAGNKVLIGFSKLLKIFAQDKSYEVFRLNSDQFALLDQVAYIDTEKYEIEFSDIQKQIKEFKVYISEANKELNVNATIGMSLGQEYPLEHADMALNNAKHNHKPYAVYNTQLDNTKEMQLAIKWQHKIINALENNSIVPVFQPIVDNKSIIVKYEALMRIEETEDGEEKLLLPEDFLEIAIKSKYYDSISSMMINKVFDFLQTNKHTFSINLTFSDIKNKPFMDTLHKRITKEKIGDRLIIEITENENIKEYPLLTQSLKKFRQLGVKIAIDDFGSSYANFSHILEINPEYVKIDGTLIKNIDIDPRSYILTKAITAFCHELGIKVIAEYVHSEDVYNILKKLEVDQFQGFYFSEPLRNI